MFNIAIDEWDLYQSVDCCISSGYSSVELAVCSLINHKMVSFCVLRPYRNIRVNVHILKLIIAICLVFLHLRARINVWSLL